MFQTLNQRIKNLETKSETQSREIKTLKNRQKTSKQDEKERKNLKKARNPEDEVNLNQSKSPKSKIRKTPEQKNNISPRLKKKIISRKTKNGFNQSSTINIDKKKRKVLYMSDRNSLFNKSENLKKNVDSEKKIKNLKIKQKKSINGMMNRISQELISNQVKMESVKKLYFKRKSKIDNTLEKLKFEKLFPENGNNLIHFPASKKLKQYRQSDDPQIKKAKKNLKMEKPGFVKRGTFDSIKNNGDFDRTSNRSFVAFKNMKKRLRIQKLDKKPSKIMKIASNHDLQPKINIYHKVRRVC